MTNLKQIKEYAMKAVGLTQGELDEALNHPFDHIFDKDMCDLCNRFQRYVNVKEVLVRYEVSRARERQS